MDTREVATDVDYGTDTSPANIAKMLRTMHPFHTYFEYAASRRYPRKASSHARVEQMIGDHRFFYWLSRTLDVVLVLIPLSLAFVAAVILIGYKTLWQGSVG